MDQPIDFVPADPPPIEAIDLAARLVDLVAHAQAASTPELMRMSRINHGRALGLNEAISILTGVEPPKLGVESYHEEKASDKNLGYEALKLLDQYGCQMPHGKLLDWEKKVEQLLEVWRINSKGEAITAAVSSALPQRDVFVITAGRGNWECKTMGELLSLRFVQEAMRDDDAIGQFRCLVIDESSGDGLWLCAQHTNDVLLKGDTRIEVKNTRIGKLDKAPKWLNLRRV